MFVFEKEQLIHTIGGVKIGGNPGDTSTVLAGTIFYSGHKIVSDPRKGVFDKTIATSLVQKQDEMSAMTGNPALVQIFSESEEALKKYIDFVADLTAAPFLIDSTEPMVRISGLRYAEEVGLIDRAIYNSLNVSATEEEIDTLREIQHECALLLAFNPQDPSIAGRRAILEKGALTLNKGLLDLAKELGIIKPLIDTAVTAIVSKTVYGQPTGSGVHNAPSSWPWLRKYRKVNRESFLTADAASNLIVQMMGADFVLYGPIENAERVFPVIAMGDVFTAEASDLEFGVSPSDDHPYKKLL
jgi:tetrahydromethanopterin S-methyltransferase subunit H